jgi:hypothetical protein
VLLAQADGLLVAAAQQGQRRNPADSGLPLALVAREAVAAAADSNSSSTQQLEQSPSQAAQVAQAARTQALAVALAVSQQSTR